MKCMETLGQLSSIYLIRSTHSSWPNGGLLRPQPSFVAPYVWHYDAMSPMKQAEQESGKQAGKQVVGVTLSGPADDVLPLQITPPLAPSMCGAFPVTARGSGNR